MFDQSRNRRHISRQTGQMQWRPTLRITLGHFDIFLKQPLEDRLRPPIPIRNAVQESRAMCISGIYVDIRVVEEGIDNVDPVLVDDSHYLRVFFLVISAMIYQIKQNFDS
ncbi:hypothetical protein VDGL01_12687 [Verticillium dahliae]